MFKNPIFVSFWFERIQTVWLVNFIFRDLQFKIFSIFIWIGTGLFEWFCSFDFFPKQGKLNCKSSVNSFKSKIQTDKILARNLFHLQQFTIFNGSLDVPQKKIFDINILWSSKRYFTNYRTVIKITPSKVLSNSQVIQNS